MENSVKWWYYSFLNLSCNFTAIVCHFFFLLSETILKLYPRDFQFFCDFLWENDWGNQKKSCTGDEIFKLFLQFSTNLSKLREREKVIINIKRNGLRRKTFWNVWKSKCKYIWPLFSYLAKSHLNRTKIKIIHTIFIKKSIEKYLNILYFQFLSKNRNRNLILGEKSNKIFIFIKIINAIIYNTNFCIFFTRIVFI